MSSFHEANQMKKTPLRQRGAWQMYVIIPLLGLLTSIALYGCSNDKNDDALLGSDTNAEIYYSNAFGSYRSLVYIPSSITKDEPPPLVVVLHGANTTAEQQRAANLFDPVAKRDGFVVMYPDHETNSLLGPHPLQSWRMYDIVETQRGMGDADAIAKLTQQVIQDWNIDPERVYIVGMSAGGWMTSIMGAAYPDIYAAIGIVEAGAYAMGTALIGLFQPLGPTLVPPEVPALAAYLTMGPYARVVPMINFQGDKDLAATPASGAQAVKQWLMTNNLTVSGSPYAPLPLSPNESIDITPTDGYPYHIDIYRDKNGCRVVEQVRIEEMEHFWPGGSDDPKLAGFTDPLAPSGAEISWEFFKRFRLSDTSIPCLEAKI